MGNPFSIAHFLTEQSAAKYAGLPDLQPRHLKSLSLKFSVLSISHFFATSAFSCSLLSRVAMKSSQAEQSRQQ